MNKPTKTILLIFTNILVVIAIYFTWNLPVFFKNSNNFVDDLLTEESDSSSDDQESQQRNFELIKEFENNKILESLAIREKKLIEKENLLKIKENKFENERLALEKDKISFLAQKDILKKERDEQDNYDKKLISLANKFTSMPPQQAVERLISIGDDSYIIDIINKIDTIAIENEKTSIVPFFISLMPKEDASRIVRKSMVNF